MRALARYVRLKTAREGFMRSLIFVPLALVSAPIAVLLVSALVMKNVGSPIFLARTASGALIGIAAASTSLCAAMAAFWIFRQEIEDHSIAAFVLATRPLFLSITASAYGTLTGIVSFIILLPLLWIAIGTFPSGLIATLLLVIVSAMLASTCAAALASKSADYGMLLPILFTVPVTVFIIRLHIPTIIAACIASALLPLVAATLLERRCAA